MENRVWERKNKKSRLFSLEVHQGTRHGLFPASLCPSFLFLQSVSEVLAAPCAGPSLPAQLGPKRGQGRGLWRGPCPGCAPRGGQRLGDARAIPSSSPGGEKQVSCGAAAPVPRPRAQRQPRREPGTSLCHIPATALLPLSHPERGEPRLSPSVLVSHPSVRTAGPRRARGQVLGLSRGLVLQLQLQPWASPPRDAPELWGQLPALDLGRVPALASPQSPAVPPPLAAPGGEGDRCLQLLLLVPVLSADPTPEAPPTQRETEEMCDGVN